MNGRPVFELKPFPRDPLLPTAIPEEIFTVGVPTMGPKYNRRDALELVVHPTGSAVICFGGQPFGEDIGLELATGHVVWMYSRQLQSDMPHLASIAPGFVNSSLGCFNACVQVVIARFPYYSRHSEDGVADAVGDELADQLTQIDPAAMDHNTFWYEFTWDMRIGDYATEDILED
jgi:hypothetical protein